MPLLEGTDGVQKMSKSLGNYIGITEPASEIFGKVMSISDELMMKYYELLSSASSERVEEIKAARVHPRDAKEALASELVERYWGLDAASKAAEGFRNLFKKHEVPEVVEEAVLSGSEGTGLAKALVSAGLAASTSEARRLVEQGGVKVDGVKVSDWKMELPKGKALLVQVGKRFFKRISFS
jgi:tyrosyl-tRNA synthetase